MRGLSGYWGAIYQFLISGPRSSLFPGCLVDSIEVGSKAALSIEIITIVEPTKNCRQGEFDLKMMRTLTILLPITSLGL
jgi:hypothetical protein